MDCPKCGNECDRDEVDVGVGVIYGPYGCYACGWSDDPEYDSSEGESEKQKQYPNHYVDPCGGLTPLKLKKTWKVKGTEINLPEFDELGTEMRVKEVTYERLHNLGNYENEKASCTIILNDNESVEDAFIAAKQFVMEQLQLDDEEEC